MRVRDLVNRFLKFAPAKIAVKGDPIGLQIGSLDAPVHKIMTTLDVRPRTVDEAIKKHVDFIFAHHPVMFHPAHNLDLSVPQNEMYAQIIRHHITVYAAHSNLDSANGGMNDWLAKRIHLHDVKGLVPMYHDDQHSYYMGRVGNLSQPISVMGFAKKCKKYFNVSGLRLITLHPDRKIQRVAILGGSGDDFYHDALRTKAQLYVTGDVYYHTAHDMLANGLSVVDPGHHIEAICIPHLAKLFDQWNHQYGWNVKVVESKVNTDPFTFI
ncbi:Nif3-like dinuclear metal center hexameric protein [Acetilactobacillus jinshanensis]|uniref:GTP cyclohydrolase 1 type 2 homolog n=1 Tax=Acetilactobacillus jinshanensis TaxID=1720083 RepID=A0A4P6ZJS1_9LACO|nr:Nif3-like dinuclear metal center hexameric protein [Acetilactobacillus jinshanensis]QBP17991.1 Nif3-like dinuclear metal center hexameric protein [Acetilactobacillus jinshanensis]URL60853.1 Nif3-like dinuclear metal center hexameric protein [uncultured bacterium]